MRRIIDQDGKTLQSQFGGGQGAAHAKPAIRSSSKCGTLENHSLVAFKDGIAPQYLYGRLSWEDQTLRLYGFHRLTAKLRNVLLFVLDSASIATGTTNETTGTAMRIPATAYGHSSNKYILENKNAPN